MKKLYNLLALLAMGAILAKDVNQGAVQQAEAPVSVKPGDSKVPDFANYDYLATLVKKTRNSIPNQPTVENIRDFVSYVSRGLMYSLQATYLEFKIQFALLSLQANELQLSLLANLVDKNFSSFKSIPNRNRFFELIGEMRDACKKIQNTIAQAKTAGAEEVDLLRRIARTAHEQNQKYQKISAMLKPQFTAKASKPVQTIQQLSGVIETIFSEVDEKLAQDLKTAPQRKPKDAEVALADAKLPDTAKYAYLTELLERSVDSVPAQPTVANIEGFFGLVSHGFMYSLPSPYQELVTQFSLLNLQANELLLELLSSLVKDNFSSFKKTIANREKFFELLEHMRNACKKTREAIVAAKLNKEQQREALQLIANFAQQEKNVFDKIVQMLAPQFTDKMSVPIRSIRDVTNKIGITFDELNKRLRDYQAKAPQQPKVAAAQASALL